MSDRKETDMKSDLSGTLGWAFNAVVENPGLTAMELAAKKCPMDPRKIGRRLPELVELGYVRRGDFRKCSLSNVKSITWYPS